MPVGGEVVGPGISGAGSGGTGPQGAQGAQGAAGAQGAQGAQGASGSPTYTYASVTADPNPAVVQTYYHCHYAGNGNFTLPSSALTNGNWIEVKQVSNNTLSIVGTVDGNAAFTLTQYDSYVFVWNGTNWDIN